MSKPHFVLVHGAFHRAWHLQSLVERLEKAGYPVSTLDLPSVNQDIAKVPREGGLRADVDAVKAVIEEAALNSAQIILVFHSYGGVPGGEAAAELSEAAKEKVQRLVYMCAFVIEQGTAVTTASKGQVAPWAALEGHAVVVPDPIPVFYQNTKPDLAKDAADHVCPQSYSALTELTQHAPWTTFPCTYIHTTEDNAVPFWMQEAFLATLSPEERAKWQIATMEGDHSPFLTKPDECAQLLEEIALGSAF